MKNINEILKATIFLLLLVLFPLNACKYNAKEKSTGDLTVLHCLNYLEDALHESPMYDNVEIVKLETKSSCLISEITRVEMNDSYFFIKDFDNLYTFTRNGKFVAQIGEKGNGPNEYITLSTFFIDDKKQQISIVDNYKSIFINYNYEGRHISTTSIPRGTLKGCHYALSAPDNNILLSNMMDMNNSKPYSLIDIKKRELIGDYLSYEPIRVGNYMYAFS